MSAEEILEAELPIVDPHHHLWDRRRALAGVTAPPAHPFEAVVRRSPHYLLDQLLADLGSGHRVEATVFVECGAMYRAGGPPELACVGETEFVNGVAAMSASGVYGETRACAAIVGRCDFNLGDGVGRVLEAHIAAGGGRFRGVRQSASHDPDPAVLGPMSRTPPGLYASDGFRAGFRHLARHGLSFDAWLLEPQLPELIGLTRKFPETVIILDHVGTPLGIGPYEGRREARFDVWRDNIRALAESPNVFCKLGGLAMPFAGFPSFMAEPPAPSQVLADEWRPYVETCIEAFGPQRCMFESNFPVDAGTCDYATLWNAFKRLVSGASAGEKAALFHQTARHAYRLNA